MGPGADVDAAATVHGGGFEDLVGPSLAGTDTEPEGPPDKVTAELGGGMGLGADVAAATTAHGGGLDEPAAPLRSQDQTNSGTIQTHANTQNNLNNQPPASNTRSRSTDTPQPKSKGNKNHKD